MAPKSLPVLAAVELSAGADELLITEGAGMDVESGLPAFRMAKGFRCAYPALVRRGL